MGASGEPSSARVPGLNAQGMTERGGLQRLVVVLTVAAAPGSAVGKAGPQALPSSPKSETPVQPPSGVPGHALV